MIAYYHHLRNIFLTIYININKLLRYQIAFFDELSKLIKQLNNNYYRKLDHFKNHSVKNKN